MKKTMVGVAPNPLSPRQKALQNKSTIVGLPAIGAPPQGVPASPVAGSAFGKKTMVGLQSPFGDVPPVGPAQPVRPIPDHKRTMLGVAMPGIAPLAPGVSKEPIDAPHQADGAPLTFDTAGEAAPRASLGERRTTSRPPPPKQGPRISAAVALISGLLLAAAAAAFAVLWRSPAPLRAEARVDSSGTDLLHITCATCPDGTELRIGEAKAKVMGQTVDLALANPLGVGENVFTVDVDRPANGRDEKVSLVVKIGYRIRPDLAALEAERPLLRIAVEGAPLAKIAIDGKLLDLGPDGKATYDIDISAECTGLADDAKTIERAVSYSVAGASGGAEQGVVSLRVAVTPIRLDSPSAHAVIETDHFLLAGRVGRGGRLVAGGQPVGVAVDGGFSRMLLASELGELEMPLRASIPGLAPRIATLRIKRVERLAEEARVFSASSPLTYAELSAEVSKHIGEPVALAGDVVEARLQGARNLALLDVQKGCARPPCVARVVLSGDDTVTRGDRLQVFGHVTRAISAKGESTATVPEVEGDFFLKRR